MKTFITALKITAAVLALLIAGAYLLPRNIYVERKIVIAKDAKAIFCQVNNIKNWDYWSVWHQTDPLMQKTYGDKFEGEGASYAWSSNVENVGNGKMDILKVEENKYILTALDFGANGIAQSEYKFLASNEGTEITLNITTDMGYNPISRYYGLFLDDMIGDDFEKNLSNLKSYTEAPNYIPCDATPLALQN